MSSNKGSINLVTFIIVGYNAEKVLDNNFNCLMKQNYPLNKIEVILIDSNSKDSTKNIMLKFKEENEGKFNSIQVLDNPGKILPKGWNIALQHTHGDAIVRVDAHSTYPANFILENVKELENGEDIVGGKCISITKDNTLKEKLLLIAEESIFGCGIADFRRKESKQYVSTVAFAMYRKKVFDDVGFYNERLARTEDNEMHYRMKKRGYKFLLSPNIKSYRYARNSFMGMVKQKYGNGKWIGITLSVCPKCFSLYHFAPLVFLLAIIFSIAMAFVGLPIFAYLLTGVYALFNIINLTIITIKEKFNLSYLLLPFIFLSLHLAYGIGTLVGIFKGIILKK